MSEMVWLNFFITLLPNIVDCLRTLVRKSGPHRNKKAPFSFLFFKPRTSSKHSLPASFSKKTEKSSNIRVSFSLKTFADFFSHYSNLLSCSCLFSDSMRRGQGVGLDATERRPYALCNQNHGAKPHFSVFLP